MTTRIAAITVDDLVGLGFSEAVNCFAFGWRERPDLWPALAARHWSILTESSSWPKDQGAIAALRLILVIARSEMIPMQDAQRLHKEVVSFLDREVCANTPTMPLFRLLWDLAALHYDRGRDRSFDGALPDTLAEILLDATEERVLAKGEDDERAAQLALVGLLAFLAPSFREKLRRMRVPLTKECAEAEEGSAGMHLCACSICT